MMFRRLFTVSVVAWQLLFVAVMVTIVPRTLLELGFIDSRTILYVVQPVATLLGAGITRLLLRGKRDRIRHKADKAFIIASVLSVWFVLYFLSGLMATFVHNAIASSWQIVVLNVLTFGATVASIEYMRYGLMLLARRRNTIWFGVIVSLVLAAQQISLLQITDIASVVEIVKFVITFVVPAIVGSLLLSYLSITGGLGSQMVYGLGVVALTVLPPIIPKYDWYMTSMSSILLAVAVYIMIDRSKAESDEVRARRRRRQPKFTFDIAFSLVMVALVLFMTGVFTYKPVVIMSNSMVPVFSRGSIVVVQQLREPMDISIGDIIQYQAENIVITHRVVAIDTAENDSGDRVFTTKGDNNPSRDRPVNQSKVIGIVRSTVPYVGYPTVMLRELSQRH